MIKVINNSANLSTWYLDPGVASGDGSTKEAPIVWSENSTNNGTHLVYPIKENSGYESNRVYILMTLKAGTAYSLYINANYGPMYGELFKQTDLNTVIGNYDYSSSNTINVSEDGNYILGVYNSYSYNVEDYLTLSPAPETTVGEAGWKKKEGLVDGSGWNKITGKVFEYCSLEKASIKYNNYVNGLLYWDSNKASSISSYDDAVSKFETGANGPIFTGKFNLVDGEGSLISGYTDYFIVKMKGYVRIENPGTYIFYTNQDDQVAMRVKDITGYYSGSSGSYGSRVTVELEKGFHEFEFYFAEGSGNQYYNIKWQPPDATTYEDIPYGVFCCKAQDVPSEYFTISSPQYLTSNTSDPNWEISASGEKYGDTQAWCAFAPGNSWRGVGGTWGSGGLPSWIQWRNLNNKVLIKRYKIQGCANYGSITAWTLEGSNDGNNWTIIDTQNIGSFPSGSEFKEFDCSTNNTSYYYHRLNITASEDSDCPVGQIITYSK